MTVKGFDFSHYQGQINWQAAKAAGNRFAYGKVIEGTQYPDATWMRNRASALALGIPVGGYFWAHPNLDARASANGFLAHLNQVPGMLQPILDIEHNGSPYGPDGAGGRSPSQIHSWIHTFRDVVQAAGYRLDIYTGAWWWNPQVGPAAGNCTTCAKSRLYLSRYAPSMGEIPAPWTKAAVWQYTETGHVPGVSGYCDQDVLVGAQTLADLTYGAPTPPSSKPPTHEEIPDMFVAKPTTKGVYLLVSGAGVTIIADGESASALKHAGIPLVMLSDADFNRLKALAK